MLCESTKNSSDSGQTQPFHILALSGGGYKGLYTADFIAKVEAYTSKPFGSHFDLICGTSIGGILALALATREISAETLVKLLLETGGDLFPPISYPSMPNFIDRSIFRRTGFTLKRGIKSSKHSNWVLKNALVGLFGKRKIKDLKTRVLIPSANWSKGGPQFFKTPHHPERFVLDKDRMLVDVAMATSAAPIYLPNYKFENQIYVDGGIVGNAPGYFGVHEAEHSIPGVQDLEHRLLSIGALSSKVTADQDVQLDKGILQWKEGLFDFMMACQEQTANFMLQQKMKDRYYMIDVTPGPDQDRNVALDRADDAATETLQALAGISFQREISQTNLRQYLDHQAPDLDFNEGSDSHV